MKTRFANISAFRFFATFSLVFFHILYIGWPIEIGHWSLLRMNMLGLTAVSGFLSGKTPHRVDAKTYYKNRAVRLLLPALYCFAFMLIWSGIYFAFNPANVSFVNFFCGQRAINGEMMFIAGNYYYLIFYSVCVALTPFMQKSDKARKIITVVVIAYEIVQSYFLTLAMDSSIMVLPYVIGFWVGLKSPRQFVDAKAAFPMRKLLFFLSLAALGISLYLASHYWINGEGYWLDNFRGFIRSFGILFMTIGGLFSFLLFLRPLNRLGKNPILDFSDRYAYFFFLLDQCFVVGGTSVLWFSSNKMLQVLFVYLAVIVFGVILSETYTRFFGKKVIRVKDMAPGYRFLGYLVRWFVPFVSHHAYRLLYYLRKMFILPWINKRIEKKTVYIQRNDGHNLRICVYRPKKAKSDAMTAVIYLHGGGYGMGCADGGKPYIETFLENDDCVVFSVDYRLSFQSPYPAALEDAVASLDYILHTSKTFGVNPHQIFVAGESAGGGLAAGLCLYMRERKKNIIACQIAINPMLDDRPTNSSRFHDGPIWNHRSNIEAWTTYLGDIPLGEAPQFAAPAKALDYTNLPPLIGYVGTLDAFFDEDMAFYENLSASGVKVTYRLFPGCYHGFDTINKRHPFSRQAFAFLSESFHYAQAHYFTSSDLNESLRYEETSTS